MKNRYLRGSVRAADSTLRATARVGRILWLQTMGLLCIIFCVSLFGALLKEYQRRDVAPNAELRLIGGGCILLLFAWFAISSFVRANRLKRS
jgi:hypothetical protein